MKKFDDDFNIVGESSSLVPKADEYFAPFNNGQMMLVNRYPLMDSGSDRGEYYGSDELVGRNKVRGYLGVSEHLSGISTAPVQRGSTSTPNAGLLGIRFPFLSIVRPRVEYPLLYNEHFGRPTFVSEPLKNFEGYTVVAEIHLDGVSATMPEKEEIEQLLKGGVIL